MSCAWFVMQCRLRDITYAAPITVDIEYTRGSQVGFAKYSVNMEICTGGIYTNGEELMQMDFVVLARNKF